MYGEDYLKELVGKKVEKIFMSKSLLKFETDKGVVAMGVDGDCCSSSEFYDFYGVKNLLENGAVTEVKSVELKGDEQKNIDPANDCTQCYGYQITTESKEFGPVTSVFSFRNYSNGYYGGSLCGASDKDTAPEITDDVIELKD